VVGASDRKGSVGYGIFYNLNSNFEGEVYPVNPKWEKSARKESLSLGETNPGGN